MTNVPSLLIFRSILNCLLFFPPPLLRLYLWLRSRFADSLQQPPPSPVFSHLQCVRVSCQRKRFRRRGLAADLTQCVKNTRTHVHGSTVAGSRRPPCPSCGCSSLPACTWSRCPMMHRATWTSAVVLINWSVFFPVG